MLKNQLKFIITVILVLGFSISLQSLVAAWQEPTAVAPGVNIPKPINVGGVFQTKSGSFTTASDLGVGGDSIIGGGLAVGGNVDTLGFFNGKMNGDNIVDDTIDSSELEDNSVGSSEVADNSLTASDLAANSVGSSEIADGAVGTSEVADNSLTASDFAINSVGSSEIATDAVGYSEIATDAVRADEIAAGAVGTSEVADNSLTASDLAINSVDSSEIADGAVHGSELYCGAGRYLNGSNQCKTASDIVNDGGGSTSCSCGTCWNSKKVTTGGCSGNEHYEICTPPGWKRTSSNVYYDNCASTPYLFTNIAGNDYIENDVLATFWDMDYGKAKEMYEDLPLDKNGFAENKYRPTDQYILTNNPSINNGAIKLKIEELEPEESYPDQFKLARVLYNKNSELIIDNQTNILKSIMKKKERGVITDCYFVNQDNKGGDCLNKISDIDNLNVSGDLGSEIEFEINTNSLNDKQVYLVVNSWGSSPLPINPEFLKANSSSLLPTFFDIDGSGKYINFNHIHPREIQTNTYLDITEMVKMTKNGRLGVKMDWTQKHWINQIAVVSSVEKEYRIEELLLTKANHSSNGDVLANLSEKDQKYAHTIQGDSINLEFRPGRYIQKDNEKEAYVFISSGFYTSLRESLYPELKVDNDWQDKVDAYVEELNELK